MGVTMGIDTNQVIRQHQQIINDAVDNLITSHRIRLTSVYDKEELLSIANQVLWDMICIYPETEYFTISDIADGIIQQIELENPNALCLPSNEFETTRLGEAYGIHDDVDYTESIDMVNSDIFDALRSLSDSEQCVLILRNGFLDGNIWTLDEIAREFNLTQTRILQIESNAMKNLKRVQGGLQVYLSNYDAERMYNNESYADRFDRARMRYAALTNKGTPKAKTIIHKTIRTVTIVTEKVEERIEITTEYDDTSM